MRSMVREGAIEGVNVDEFMRLHRAGRDALDRLDVIDIALGVSQIRENRRPFSYRLNADNTARRCSDAEAEINANYCCGNCDGGRATYSRSF